ncbi:hypothetical protein [Dendronalium sp. ChiSLP03b]|uniref:hypothetical protein n=1 Tax=Dendronalium sp. ChiSLP03b TaxID=3075381 RepID=UPI002AD2C292|nr:hypothetical protein [Dendronalium sp. ChiSLP03b]MDZ8208286.1 hypothetical protein [Dendronalium sp. ChiSLP03b]
MVIYLHNFIISRKRYIQIESQPHHITGIFRTLVNSKNNYGCELNNINSAYYKCEAEGTVSFYQAYKTETENPGIWTYVVYECPAGKEQIFHDSNILTDIKLLKKLINGHKLTQTTVDIKDYLNCKSNEDEYLDIKLPYEWNTRAGREIASLLLDELKALKASSVFTEEVGKKYIKVVINDFIQAAREVLQTNGTAKDFETVQYKVLNKIKSDEIANLIIKHNNYRIWQAALPSKSKAVEHAFNTALSLICRMKL